MPDEVDVLLIDEPATTKLGARSISAAEARQLLHNRNATGPNPRGGEERRLLVGLTDGGRLLTLVIEPAVDPTTWTAVSGWNSGKTERKILGGWVMSKNPWTDPDPQPGDFDAELEAMDPRDIQHHPGNPDAEVIVLPGLDAEDTKRLVELAVERGKTVREVLAELVRNA